MWMIKPKFLCNQHLLGEHGEMHKFLPSFRRGHKVTGRFIPVAQIQFKNYLERHDELALEMKRRGMNHQSPLIDIPDFKEIYPDFYDMEVDINQSISDLIERCEKCSDLIRSLEY
jgi:hypothetical protein